MSKKLTHDISPKLMKEAKRLYMLYKSVNSISKDLNISRSTVTYHVKKTWQVEREMSKAELFNQLSETKRVDFTRMAQSTISIMSKALQELATRSVPPSMREATQAADILTMLDKITRLDDGSATDIVSNQDQPLTIVEVKKKIAIDPFAKKAEEVIGYEEKEEQKDED